MAEKEKIPVVAQLNEMTVLVREALDDANKFDAGLRGSNAAGARVRKQMQFVRSLAQGIRQSVQEAKRERTK